MRGDIRERERVLLQRPGEREREMARLLAALLLLVVACVAIEFDLPSGRSNPSLSQVGTSSLTLLPGKGYQRHIDVSIATAGSVGLVCQALQTAYLGLGTDIHSPPITKGIKGAQTAASEGEREADGQGVHTVRIKGGATYGMFAPGVNDLNHVTYPYLARMGLHCHIEVEREGFVPKGGAICTLSARKDPEIRPLVIRERGKVIRSEVHIMAAAHYEKNTSRIEKALRNRYKQLCKGAPSNPSTTPDLESVPLEVHVSHSDVVGGNPNCVAITGHTVFENGVFASDTVLKKGRRDTEEALGRRAAEALYATHTTPAVVDTHTADQLVAALALCPAPCTFTVDSISSHFSTNCSMMQFFAPDRKFSWTQEGERLWRVTVE
ncbi:RNA 3'-terminal phosphate cyclase [Kipferlia bialata]|uniref:RNA 3'-terminal phosphate cyclase n=1 Tax=Kipferlia bialata TaxID=797122 RepID=A0A9K3CRL7_9EUKA|nr:RNA 3'-terminal phosphate cyclase [Kipferlia bialata]|eukprot:g2331.t1